jgi:hypothetical protein
MASCLWIRTYGHCAWPDVSNIIPQHCQACASGYVHTAIVYGRLHVDTYICPLCMEGCNQDHTAVLPRITIRTNGHSVWPAIRRYVQSQHNHLAPARLTPRAFHTRPVIFESKEHPTHAPRNARGKHSPTWEAPPGPLRNLEEPIPSTNISLSADCSIGRSCLEAILNGMSLCQKTCSNKCGQRACPYAPDQPVPHAPG